MKRLLASGQSLAPDDPDPWLRDLLVVITFNVVIAALFASILRDGFVRSLVYSQAIGISIFAITKVVMWRKAVTKPTAGVIAVAVPLGAVVGTAIGFALAPGATRTADLDAALLPGSLLGAFIFGVGISYYFYSQRTIAETRARVKEEELARSEAEKGRVEAELMALQAQIEPHFLFNTLSNVASLIDSDPAAARRMLGNFTSYLRATLERSRRQKATVRDEADLLQRYLEIMSVRMGPRLRWRFAIDDAADACPMPPLLLQPLVENAIQHGLGPLPEGGELIVRAWLADGALHVEVADDGAGMGKTDSPGVGIGNVRARLASLYGERATLAFHAGQPRGLRVTMTLPLDQGRSGATGP